jgi:hypothetical protein
MSTSGFEEPRLEVDWIDDPFDGDRMFQLTMPAGMADWVRREAEHRGITPEQFCLYWMRQAMTGGRLSGDDDA